MQAAASPNSCPCEFIYAPGSTNHSVGIITNDQSFRLEASEPMAEDTTCTSPYEELLSYFGNMAYNRARNEN
jgi:hypothetical protein